MRANYRQTWYCCESLKNNVVTTNIRENPLTSLGCTAEWRRTDVREGGRVSRAGWEAA
jgi:hypothetical protein